MGVVEGRPTGTNSGCTTADLCHLTSLLKHHKPHGAQQNSSRSAGLAFINHLAQRVPFQPWKKPWLN
jgi:hypothetical protein